MKTRIKIPLPTLATRDDAESAMNDLAAAANTKRKLTARLDAHILAAQETVAAGLAEQDQVIAQKSDALRAWAEAHPEEFPKGRKSIELLAGILGFRTGTPKVALLSRAWTWDKVLLAITDRAFAFVRTRTEVDKDALLAFYTEATDKPAVDAKVLRPIGVKVVQDEGFFIEPKLTDNGTE